MSYMKTGKDVAGDEYEVTGYSYSDSEGYVTLNAHEGDSYTYLAFTPARARKLVKRLNKAIAAAEDLR